MNGSNKDREKRAMRSALVSPGSSQSSQAATQHENLAARQPARKRQVQALLSRLLNVVEANSMSGTFAVSFSAQHGLVTGAREQIDRIVPLTKDVDAERAAAGSS